MHLFRSFLILSVSSIALIPNAVAVEISTDTSAPVRTSTVDGGSPGDIEITDDGAIEVSETPDFTAITIDSSNDVILDGAVLIEDSDNTSGVRIAPGHVSDLTVGGSIRLVEDYTREDADEDEDADGPLAMGTGRTGILLEAGAGLTGSIVIGSGASVQIEGNDSAGILLLAPVAGDITSRGAISVSGNNAQALTARARIDGDVALTGSLSALGENATALRLDQGATGAVSIGAGITASGFTYSSSSNYVAPSLVDEDTVPLEERFDPDELLSGGPAVVIGGSLGSGLLIDGAVADPDPSDDESEDETKDTIEDFNENRSSGRIASYGSAPALLITTDWNGPPSEDLLLGNVFETVRDTLDDDEDDSTDEILAQFSYDYGLINRGSITGAGTNVGFDSSAVEIHGSVSTAHSVIISGGIENSGTISASAYEANATGITLGNNVETPALINSGTLQASIASETVNSAIALDILAGASLPVLENSGTLVARATGNTGEVAVVMDRSGTLTDITNTGTISGLYASDGLELTVREDGVAFDLSANTLGVTLRQYERAAAYDANGDDEIDERDTLDPSIRGNILFGSGDDALLLEGGTLTGDVRFGAGANVLTVDNAVMDGNVAFAGILSDVLLRNGATFTGDIGFGEAGSVSSFTLTSGTTYSGLLTNVGSALSIAMNGSRARLAYGTSVAADSLHIGDGATLIIEIDPATPITEPVFSVGGTAALSGNVTIAPVFTRVTDVPATYTLIAAETIIADLASGDVSLAGDLPFLYQSDLLLTDGLTDRLDFTYRMKSAAELGLDVNQEAAFGSVLELFGRSDSLSESFAGISSGQDFFRAYDQLLPQRTDASTRFLRAQSTAAFGALADQMNLLAASPEDGFKAWVQESFTVTDIKASTGVPGYNGSGLGLSAGLDIPLPSLDAFGVMMNFSSGRYEEKTGGSNPVSTSGTGAGIYALKRWENLYVRGAAQASRIDLSSLRQLDIVLGEPDNFRLDADVLDGQDISDSITGNWSGYSLAATTAVGTTFYSGKWYARPELSVDYFRFDQDGYRESALRNANLALEMSGAVTERGSASGVLALGRDWEAGGGQYRIFPEARLGFRHEFLETPYSATARFQGSETSFDVVSQETFGDSVIAGLSFNSSSSLFTARLSYDAELSGAGAVHYLGVSGVLRF